MTAEVCIMNRLAVVLAADSAATVSQWTGENVETRYFKGSNKIFQLSDHHPVGLMIFDSADIMRVPWEIVVKTFRSQLEAKSFNSVKEYADEFFNFLEQSTLMFPTSIQDEVLLDAARLAAVFAVNRDKHPDDDVARVTENGRLAEALIDELGRLPFPDGLTEQMLQDAFAKYLDPLTAHIEQFRGTFGRNFPEAVSELAILGILEVFKRPDKHLSASGLVFAGFGDREIFPAYTEFKSCGVICGKHIAIHTSDCAITHDVPARLAPFAQTAMSDTFSLGISEDVYSSVMATLTTRLADFARKMIADAGGDAATIPNFDAVVAEARREMGADVLDRAQREHAMPLRRVLSVLPVDEMAELAETLINLQALKEKVTKSSETVGGPVDVAIITKAEGLVWVKRKHFFDIGLNSRYLVRQQNRLQT
ncbi:hypothetical protein ABIA85_008865 [Bradyrhizobium sp. LA6.10]|uniref:hypothetical protein n=1 Tax=Bradyrhizobium sp. LA6.10 TaxID=3156318 RepID=UPI003390805D